MTVAPDPGLSAPDPGSPFPAGVPFDGRLLRIIAGATDGDTPGAGQREARYRRFLDALGVALYTTDAAGRITFFNRAATAFWGRVPALGEAWCGSLRMFTTDGQPLAHDACPMAIALRTGVPVHGAEAVAERPDGTRVTFMAYPTPLHDDDGELLGAVNVLVDISERRRAEDGLRATADALARSNAVKDEFLGLVSHELRTPVTTILGNARLLRDRGGLLDVDTARGMLGDIDDEAHRLHAIIENLLALTRLSTSAAVEREPQLVGRVVADVVASFRRRHPERVIETRVGDGSAIVEADEALLHLLLENFLGNAHKYSPPGTPIEVAVSVSEGREVEIRVLDRGIGLGDASVDELFQPFVRGSEARLHAGGVGIGLAVCRRIIDSLGGRAWAVARPGGGTEFGAAIPMPPGDD